MSISVLVLNSWRQARRRVPVRFAWLCLAAGLVYGCGGGGGGGDPGGGGGGGGPTTFTVSTSAGTGGTISPASASVAQGSTASFTVTPLASHDLVDVSGCGGTLSGNTFTTGAITAACTVTATFAIKTYSVTVQFAVIGAGGSVSPASATVDHGDTAQFEVTPDAGFEIAAVTGCGGSLAGNVYTTGPVTADCVIEVSFAEVAGSAPTGVSATAGDAQVTVSWSPVDGATAYNVYWSSTPGIHPGTAASYDDFAPDVSSPYIVTGLANGTTYYFVVTAMVGAAESDASSEVSAAPSAPAAPLAELRLNDTGVDWCMDYASVRLACPVEGFPGQDGELGRDAAATAGTLAKVGGGHAGFDFTKLGADGTPLAIQDGEWDEAGSEAAGTRWSCVRDNHMGLTWEVKVNDAAHLRHRDHRYAWFDPDESTNGGASGPAEGGSATSCVGLDECTTLHFIAAVNAAGLCGTSDWRLPAVWELRSIVHYDRSTPAIDRDYFPNIMWTDVMPYWSSTTLANSPQTARHVAFSFGSTGTRLKNHAGRVRLVRADPQP